MNKLHSSILAGGLLLSPLLMTAAELVRTTVARGYAENEADPVADAAAHLHAVADHLGLWHAAAYLNLAFLLAWGIAMTATTMVIARTRPTLGAAAGLLALVSVVGIAFHWAFYYLPLASLARVDDRDLAAHAAAAYGEDGLMAVALLMFLAGTLLAVVTTAIGLWRARALPWWGSVGLVVWLGYVMTGPEARPAALLNLALLLPFAAVARRLSRDAGPVSSPEPAVAPS